MYKHSIKVKLHDTDAAGILFFSNQFKFVHEAYEMLLENIGFGFNDIIQNKPFFLPIVHAESDYKKPLFVGDEIEIHVRIENVGDTSFTFGYKLLNADNELVGTAKTVHVTISKETRRKISLPNDLRAKIEELYRQGQV